METITTNGEPETAPAFELDLETVSAEERQGCGEFFLGRANKTPERYMRIRNHMVQQWEAIRPQYLTKIGARAELRNCGDVNAIGRVHAFLEASNIINSGAVIRIRQQQQQQQAVQRKRRTVSPPTTDDLAGGAVIEHHVVERWADDAHSESSSADEDGMEKRRGRRRQQRHRRIRRRRSSADYSDGGGGGGGSDKGEYAQWTSANGGNSEFRLVPCHTFGGDMPAPFAVTVAAAALALMDLHAHLMYTEIIGLLGGRFDAAKGALHIETAFPCRNISSSTTECEMDPESEYEARKAFDAAGQSFVGWYHSHPTFDAIPSVRDTHNQRVYQDLFRSADRDAEPFVGLIVSPPGAHNADPAAYGVSDISAFHMVGSSRSNNSSSSSNNSASDIPFAVPYTVCSSDRIPSGLVGAMEELIHTHATMAHRVDLSKRFRRNEAMTTLEKLVISMRSHWDADARQQWDDAVSLHVRPLIQKHFRR
ncbi:hypothetical protein LPJ81_000328 [Coemansia sp. IMI 209127]|nr:hypothetical protein LPJ81_000328 [Coemansia sp. IMI 209127]